MKPRKTPARLTVPSWLYEGADNIVKRTAEVEAFVAGLQFVKQPLRVQVSPELFTTILNDDYIAGTYSFYVSKDFKDLIPEVGFIEDGKRWLRLCNTLFVEE